MSAQPERELRLTGGQVRSRRSREAVLNAFLALIEEGDLSPTAERVAVRSGVSLRTVYHQFADMESLQRLAGERLLERVRQIPDVVDTGLPLGPRVDAFVRHRVAVYDVLHPLSSAARLREPRSAVLRASRDEMLRYGTDNTRKVFAPELSVLSEVQATRTVAAIGLATNWSSWYALIEELKQSRAEAVVLMRASTRAFLTQPEQFG